MLDKMIITKTITVWCPYCSHWLSEQLGHKDKIVKMKKLMREHIKECDYKTRLDMESILTNHLGQAVNAEIINESYKSKVRGK
jgi:hypothetical protein